LAANSSAHPSLLGLLRRALAGHHIGLLTLFAEGFVIGVTTFVVVIQVVV
jgi:hypothetical protein